MADAKTEKKTESPEVINLRERAVILEQKVKDLDAADANEYKRKGFDIGEIKQRAQLQLAEVKREITKLTK